MRFSFLILLLLISLSTLFAQQSNSAIKKDGASAQKSERFRFGAIHKLEERESYSIFYPVGLTEYDGVVILIGSNQSTNPKAYGKLIEHLLTSRYIVIFPAYQSFGWSNNKKDIEYIKNSLFKAYDDIEQNYAKVMTLPVAFIGHSMGAIITYELALGVDTAPKKPSALISLSPAEVRNHKITQLNFRRLDNYDTYLVIEEEKDKFYRRKTGTKLYENLSAARRKKYILHKAKKDQKSNHLNAWAYDKRFSSKNNGVASYFTKCFGKTNNIDKDFYWPQIDKALKCAFSRDGCEEFRTKIE